MYTGFSNGKAGRKESFGAAFSGLAPQYGGSGAQPISMSGSNRAHPRRESMAGSLAGAMSWGGVSVGSWIRDEYVYQVILMPHSSSMYPCGNLNMRLLYSSTNISQCYHAEHTDVPEPVTFFSFFFVSSQNGGELHEGLYLL